MKNFLSVFTSMLSAVIPLHIVAQNPAPAPQIVNQQQQIQIDIRKQLRRQQELERLNNISKNSQPAIYSSAGTKYPAYRKPTKKDLLLVAPDAADQTKYADFLRQPNTGLIRLFSDAGCQQYSSVTVASDFCIKY